MLRIVLHSNPGDGAVIRVTPVDVAPRITAFNQHGLPIVNGSCPQFGQGFGPRRRSQSANKGYTFLLLVIPMVGSKDFQGLGRYCIGAFPGSPWPAIGCQSGPERRPQCSPAASPPWSQTHHYGSTCDGRRRDPHHLLPDVERGGDDRAHRRGRARDRHRAGRRRPDRRLRHRARRRRLHRRHPELADRAGQGAHLRAGRPPRVEPAASAAAIRTGLAEASGDFVLYTDADMPFDLTQLHKAIRLIDIYDADIVSAYRHDRTGEGARRAVVLPRVQHPGQGRRCGCASATSTSRSSSSAAGSSTTSSSGARARSSTSSCWQEPTDGLPHHPVRRRLLPAGPGDLRRCPRPR